MSSQDTQFKSRFWNKLHDKLAIEVRVQRCLPTKDRWPVREDYPNIRGCIEFIRSSYVNLVCNPQWEHCVGKNIYGTIYSFLNVSDRGYHLLFQDAWFLKSPFCMCLFIILEGRGICTLTLWLVRILYWNLGRCDKKISLITL